MVYHYARQILDGLLPPQCQFCGGAAAELPLCNECFTALPWNQSACPRCALPQNHDGECAHCLRRAPTFDRAWCAFRLEAPIQQSIHGLKYQARFLQARMLGSLLAQQLAQREQLPELLIPVPLHGGRLFRRGYNQALELARVIARSTHMRLLPQAARRRRATADQIGMSAAQRRRNVRNAFTVDAQVKGCRVALLDDVMTTGATLGELARACKHAGATEVEAWAVARVA